jgi:4-amino-4-deoxy-L-arabinose transferase-like glycosyltransferase
VVLALSGRVVAALVIGGHLRFPDEGIYLDAAARLRSGAGFAPTYTNVPGYPAVLAVLGLFAPSGVLQLRIAQAGFAAVGCWLCYAVGRRLGGEGPGLIAAGMYAVDPVVVGAAALFYPETVASLCLAAALVVAWEAVRQSKVALAACGGILLGCFALLRPVGLILVPVTASWIGLGSTGTPRRRTALALALCVSWALVLLPWTWRNYRLQGRLVPISTAGTAGFLAPEVASDSTGELGPLGEGAGRRRQPVGLVVRTGREFLNFWELYPRRIQTDDPDRRLEFARSDPRLSTAPVLPPSLRDLASASSFAIELLLAAVGLVVGWKRRRSETVWLVGTVLAFALGYAVFYGKLRYRIPILPILFGFAGVGLANLVAGAAPRLEGRLGGGVSPAGRLSSPQPDGTE